MHHPLRNREPRTTLQMPAESVILDAIRSMDYGSIEITIHASRVVQIECKKKIRFPIEEEKES